ncbi:MAG: hypothetical protein KAS75_03215 [Planctomycetes bacterium]|nr:hypothetical protein [Planctomycetota bacterium]
MNNRNEENLEELFGKFFNPEEAGQAEEDIRKTEQILSENPAPKPDEELIADIKAQVTAVLLHKTAFRQTVYKVAAVAAIFLVLAGISVKLFEKQQSERIQYASIMPAVLWESDDIITDDADLAVLNAEIDQIENDAIALRLGTANSNGNGDLTELETELMEIDNDFWKG